MNQTVSIAEIKSRLSDYVAKSDFKGDRFIITKRNKPVAALVSIDDLQAIEQQEEKEGLISAVGKWKDFQEMEKILEDVFSSRKSGGMGRDVSL
ncbi:MAG: type II toxin-antitoxin system Phd/YefM family antitoxin [Proteobacteria bacterium]|nr:type II toxin-antitoxin system Phd/YefM family antitoxin [Pseudomonadota bacterium]